MSLASAGAAIAQKRSMSLYIPVFTELGTANQDESEGEWGKGKEEAQEAYQQYKAPALGEVAAFGFGQIDAVWLLQYAGPNFVGNFAKQPEKNGRCCRRHSQIRLRLSHKFSNRF